MYTGRNIDMKINREEGLKKRFYKKKVCNSIPDELKLDFI